MAFSTINLMMVAIMGGIALFMGMVVVTFRIITLQRQAELVRLKAQKGIDIKSFHDRAKDRMASKKKDVTKSTVANTDPTKHENLYLWKQPERRPPHQLSLTTSAEAYWSQYQHWLSSWDGVEMASKQYKDEFEELWSKSSLGSNKMKKSSLLSPPPNEHVHTSLLKAAELGNPDAQHHVASALASGIWLTGQEVNDTQIMEDFVANHEDSFQTTSKAYLYWHMAAIHGNVEAAISLGYRMKPMFSPSMDGKTPEEVCERALPYYEAAANGIVDELEASPLSRAKINPPMDRHVLPEIHMHGGTSSQLKWDSKPDETPDALQYYHLLSTRTPEPDIGAAYTLAQLYHHGLRGVPQNLTKALFYYEIAADHKHWEAAGQAGKFHVWSMGVTERNLVKAHKYFQMGTPYGLEGCRRRYDQKIIKRSKMNMGDEDDVVVCDHPSLNGMGLLYLFGVPMILAPNPERAQAYFRLAHMMENMDASYNLAMLKLGYKTSWKNIEDDKGMEVADDGFLTNQGPNVPSKSDIVEAVQTLKSAAGKGHLQAHHRLGMIFSRGIRLPGEHVAIQAKCTIALEHFEWVVHNASPMLSQRTRTAYKQYANGDGESALKNYLLAAETGHTLSQVNAAFLLDQGVCLHLSPRDCRRASLRLWKVAAQAGNPEAALRVGDSYYYGTRQRQNSDWTHALLFPEKHVAWWLQSQYKNALQGGTQEARALEGVCTVDDETCRVEEDDSDLDKAAHYYRLASQQHKSPRAHFNLGFMHEWGLGLTQDFPLAKRHYDLAASSSQKGEANLAVQLALWTMHVHQAIVKFRLYWEQQWEEESPAPVPFVKETYPVPSPKPSKTRLGIILKHVVSWESVLIIVLTYILSKLFQHRRTQR